METKANRVMKRRAIPSYGIILYTVTKDGQYLYLLDERRDSISYTEYLKDCLPINLIPMHINLMSKEERHRCVDYYKNENFTALWDDLWTNHKNRVYKSEFTRCALAFQKNMAKYLPYFEDGGGQDSNPWGFAKGRKHLSESQIACALREFEEETTIPQKSITLLDVPPFEELYVGTDSKLYQTVYYLAYIDHLPKVEIKRSPHNIRKTRISDEVSAIGWFSYGEASKRLDREKKKILEHVNSLLLFNCRRRTIRRKTC